MKECCYLGRMISLQGYKTDAKCHRKIKRRTAIRNILNFSKRELPRSKLNRILKKRMIKQRCGVLCYMVQSRGSWNKRIQNDLKLLKFYRREEYRKTAGQNI